MMHALATTATTTTIRLIAAPPEGESPRPERQAGPVAREVGHEVGNRHALRRQPGSYRLMLRDEGFDGLATRADLPLQIPGRGDDGTEAVAARAACHEDALSALH